MRPSSPDPFVHRARSARSRGRWRRCYAENASFRDIAPKLEGRTRIHAMWHMICDGDTRTTFKVDQVDDRTAFVTVVDDYTFRQGPMWAQRHSVTLLDTPLVEQAGQLRQSRGRRWPSAASAVSWPAGFRSWGARPGARSIPSSRRIRTRRAQSCPLLALEGHVSSPEADASLFDERVQASKLLRPIRRSREWFPTTRASTRAATGRGEAQEVFDLPERQHQPVGESIARFVEARRYTGLAVAPLVELVRANRSCQSSAFVLFDCDRCRRVAGASSRPSDKQRLWHAKGGVS